jgi:hypothetical protein
MENTPLHAQKVTILSRLIKESSLTLEEALLLLKEEEEEIEVLLGPPIRIRSLLVCGLILTARVL